MEDMVSEEFAECMASGVQTPTTPNEAVEAALAASEALQSHEVTVNLGTPLTDSQTFILPSGVTLMLCRQNILQTNAKAISTSEPDTLNGRGEVSRVLLQSCPRDYLVAREQMKEETAKFEYGKVYSCSSGKTNTDTNSVDIAFETVYHAIVPNAWVFFGLIPTKYTLTGTWDKYMRQLYKKLFHKADKDGKSSLALPLFGCGGAGASFDKAIASLVGSLMSIGRDGRAPGTLRNITIYTIEDKAFTKLVTKLEESLRFWTQPAIRLPVQDEFSDSDDMGRPADGYRSAMSRENGKNWVYRMESEPRGKALIIDNEIFSNPEFPNRKDSWKDSRMLYDLFQNRLGFRVTKVRNLTAEQMHAQLLAFTQDEALQHVDCCVVAILSHGGQGDVIYGVDAQTVSGKLQPGTFIHTSDVQSLFIPIACPAMRAKPKLFIGQFCRGVLVDTVRGLVWPRPVHCDATVENTPSFADMYFLYATVPKLVAYRGPFVEMLCKVIRKHAHSRHIKDMATILHNEMGQLELGEYRQYLTIPEERGTLRKNLYFNPPPPSHVTMV